MVVPFTCSEEDIRAAGLSCSEDQPCPVYLELTAADSDSGRTFAIGNIHTEAITLYSILLSSADGGKTWTEPFERIPAAGLDRIQFLDSQNGWITGGILSPLPRDPFFLITGDGGKAWTRHPLFSEDAENRFGAIGQVAASGNSDISAIIDRGQGSDGRYVLYESTDAGQTWQVRQESSKAIPLPHAASRSDAWRARADAASKSFVVEHRSGSAWEPIAKFSVRLNPCVPPQ